MYLRVLQYSPRMVRVKSPLDYVSTTFGNGASMLTCITHLSLTTGAH